MPHIVVDPTIPGIRAFMDYRTDTGKVLSELAETLLRAPSPLTSGEREMIAAVVSWENECVFCCSSHSAAAKHQLGGRDSDMQLVEAVKQDFRSAPISPKMKALLAIAQKVQKSGKEVSPQDIAAAKAQGADDRTIHDTVLIAAAFCMYNRYVDGLAALTPTDPKVYDAMGERMAKNGYMVGSVMPGGQFAPIPPGQTGASPPVTPAAPGSFVAPNAQVPPGASVPQVAPLTQLS